MAFTPTLSVFDLRFLLSRSHSAWLPEELGGLAPLGPTGIRNVQGVGNQTANPVSPAWWLGAADTLFTRISFNRLLAPQKNDVISGPFANSTRGTTFAIGNTVRVLANGTALPPSSTLGTVVDSLNPRTISNLIADVSNPIGFQALDPADPNYAIKQELLEQDNPVGRIGPADGGINPLPYSNWLSQFGQFFDHGLDFVAKGVDGAVQIGLLPSDSLYDRAGSAKYITASRNNTVNVTIGVGSTDSLLTKLGITQATNSSDFISWNPLTTALDETKGAGEYFAFQGTLVLNNKIIELFASDAQDLVTQINDWTPTTGVVASLTRGPGGAALTLTPARAESFNQISPPVDLSQNYGSDNSRTFFVREYLSEAVWTAAVGQNAPSPTLTDLTTGRLVNAGALVNGEAASGQADWDTVKANASNVGIILHDKDVNDVPLVAFDATGHAILGADGLPRLVAINKVTGEQVYVQNSYLAADALFAAGGALDGLSADYVLATTGHAFLNDKAAFSLAGTSAPQGWQAATGYVEADFLLTASGDNPANYDAAMAAYFAAGPGGFTFQALGQHKIAGDGRLNENIGLTAVHEVFTNEHNRVFTQLKTLYGMPDVLPAGGFDWTDPLTNQVTRITNEDLFQQAKIWCEMMYQHLTFDSFIRKLSPNVAGFAGVVPNLDSQIFAEFAHAVYRLGHSMLPEVIGLRKFDGADSLSTTNGSADVIVTLAGHGLKSGNSFTLSGVDTEIGGIAAADLNGTYVVQVLSADTFSFTAASSATSDATGSANDQVLLDLSRSLIGAFLSPDTFIPGSTAGLLADGSSAQVGYRIDEKVSDSLRDNLLGRPLDLATLNLMRGRDGGLPTLNELRASIAAVAPVLLQPTLQAYSSWLSFRDNLKGTLDQQNATVKNFMMAYAADSILTQFGATARAAVSAATLTDFGGLDTLEEWYNLRASTDAAQSDEYMLGLKAATNAAFANATWMGTGAQGNKDFNRIDAWIGGLAEKEVVGGMLGSTFDAIFAIQMMNLQNGDFFYYLGRVPNTEFFVENMEGNQYSDLVIRNTTATDIYGDIFSVADAYIKLADTAGGNVTAANLAALAAITTTQQVFDLNGNVIQAEIGTAGYVGNVFTGNQGNYVDARGVLNPNGVGNASEMISGTIGADRVDALGGNDTVRADAGNDTINGGSGVDYLYGEAGNDTINGDAENDFIYGGDGNDSLLGGLGIDVIFGHAGNDTIYGGLDADVIVGGSGDDVVYGGDGVSVTLAVVDPLHPDVLTVLDPEPAVAVGPLDDNISGGSGNDTLYGGGGWDALLGQSGHDVLLPGVGGADILGREALDGGHGDDLYIVEYASWFLDGNYTDSGLTTDQLVNKNTFRAGNGNGTDEVRFTQNVAADIVLGGTNLQGVAQLFSGIERVVIGTGFGNLADRTGTALINIDASLVGTPGAPGSTQGLELLGNAAGNILVGTAFDDVLDGGVGADTLEGGLGNDTYVVDNAGDVITEGLLGGGLDTVRVAFNTNYTLTAPDLENLTLVGTNGTANINGTGNALSNTIIGNAGNNVLLGLAGNDNLQGAAGNDTLDGGTGADVLFGGAGRDIFKFSSVAEIGNNPLLRETVADFVSGTDRLDFTSIDANTGLAGFQQFTFVNAFTGAGQLLFANGILYGNVNADLAADFQISFIAPPGTPAGAAVTQLTNADLVALPIASIASNTGLGVAEGLAGTTSVHTFTVSLTTAAASPITLNWAVNSAGLANPAAANDFVGGAFPTGTINFAAGQTTATISVSVTGDNIQEQNENFRVTLTANTPTNGLYALGTATATSVILNDDLVNGNGASTLTGTAGADFIDGAGGNDTISGLAGNDVIVGGTGADNLTGGLGADVFRYTALNESGTTAATRDIITDFVGGAAGDRIDVSAIDANANVGGNQAFTFIGGAAFSALGQVRYAGGILEFNATGNNNADMTIQLLVNPVINAGNVAQSIIL